MKNFGFNINVSVEAYKSKEEAGKCLYKEGAKELGREKMAFFEKQVTIDEFLYYATSGHTFCALFDYDPDQMYWIENSLGKKEKISPVYRRGKNIGAMNIKMKRDQFFRGAQAIFVDVDYTRFLDVQDYINALTYKPTCVYMSFSDNIEKGGIRSRRFRLVYVFDRVLDANEFIWVSSAITRQIEQDTNEPMQDKCGERRSQYMNGVYGNPEIYKTDFIYSVTDFPEPPSPQPVVTQPEILVAASPPQIVFDERLLYDMETLSYEEFMHFNSWRGYYYRTEKPEWETSDNGYEYQFTDDNYLQIWFSKEKITDGNHRRSKLYKNACLRRLMYPDMTPDTAIFNLYIDFIRFFDNSDGVITMDTLKDKIIRAFESSYEDLIAYCADDIKHWQTHKPKYIIKNTLIDNRAVVKGVEKIINYAYLDTVYVPSKSVQENLASGIHVSSATLYRYAKDRGLQTNPYKQISEREKRAMRREEKNEDIEKFKMLFVPNTSLRKNQEFLKENGLSLSLETINKWKKLYFSQEELERRPTIQAPISSPETDICRVTKLHWELPPENTNQQTPNQPSQKSLWGFPAPNIGWNLFQ